MLLVQRKFYCFYSIGKVTGDNPYLTKSFGSLGCVIVSPVQLDEAVVVWLCTHFNVSF